MKPQRRIVFLAGTWPVLMALAAWARTRGSFDPAGVARGYNWPGDFGHVALAGAIEVAVLMLIIRPWSYQHSWGRARVAALLFGLYGSVSLVAGTHAGSLQGMHSVWLIAIGGAMAVTALVSFFAPRSDAAA